MKSAKAKLIEEFEIFIKSYSIKPDLSMKDGEYVNDQTFMLFEFFYAGYRLGRN